MHEVERIEALLQASEDEHLEFKEARNDFDSKKLLKYCAALANEGGGRIVLGITDKRPRRIIGSYAFREPAKTAGWITEQLRLKVELEEVFHPDGRILICSIPSHPLGLPIAIEGSYWMRAGEDLRAMTTDQIRRILDETGPDFSAEPHSSLTMADMDEACIQKFREMWSSHTRNIRILEMSNEQLLDDAELRFDGKLTHAALILLGSESAIAKYLGQVEVIFEYRLREGDIGYQVRAQYRRGFLGFLDDLWSVINSRNETTDIQQGLFRTPVPAFNEEVVREALLNAVTHRDYRLAGSVFVRQYPRLLEIVSPGGFPPGITPDNILWRQAPRNRRIAEACARCGLVERSGQGADRMFEHTIREGKAKPDFSGSDEYQVSLRLRGEISNPSLVNFLNNVARQRGARFSLADLLVLDTVQHEKPIPDALQSRIPGLVENGALERFGRGRGRRYILSRSFYGFIGKSGAYTRTRGLDRSTNKELILKHIRDNPETGSALHELLQVLPAQSRNYVQKILQELRREEKVVLRGQRRGGRWYPVAP